MNNIIERPEEIQKRIIEYHYRSKSYFDILVHLSNYKISRYIVDLKTGEFNMLYPVDTPEEIEIKKYLEELKNNYLY